MKATVKKVKITADTMKTITTKVKAQSTKWKPQQTQWTPSLRKWKHSQQSENHSRRNELRKWAHQSTKWKPQQTQNNSFNLKKVWWECTSVPPYLTPFVTLKCSNNLPDHLIHIVWFEYQYISSLIIYPGTPLSINFWNKIQCFTLLKAFGASKNM